MIRLIRHQ